MRASELINILANLGGDPNIIIAKDEEGNGFNDLEEIELSAVERYDGEIDVLHPDDVDEDGDYERAVVLWP